VSATVVVDDEDEDDDEKVVICDGESTCETNKKKRNCEIPMHISAMVLP
jgi:hypothetical protein